MGGACCTIRERRVVYRVLAGKSEGKRILGRPRHRREDYIKVDLQEVGCEGMDLFDLALDSDMWQPFVNILMNFQVQKNSRNLTS
jgi:hypothetical protein